LRNKESSNFVHVIGGDDVQKFIHLYHSHQELTENEATEVEIANHNSLVKDFEKYMASSLDVLDHKFLIYHYNIENTAHWRSIVAINPYLVIDPSKANEKDNLTGWISMDSMSYDDAEIDFGLKNGNDDTLEPESGFMTFMNYAASYLKAHQEREGEMETTWSYQPIFGEHDMIQGSKQFPQLLFNDPSVVVQQNSNDCSFGSVANPFALVSHFYQHPFLKNQCTRKGGQHSEDHCYFLPSSVSLKLFWGKLTLNPLFHGTVHDILQVLRKEFIILVDAVAELHASTVKEQDNFSKVKQVMTLVYEKPVPIIYSESEEEEFEEGSSKEKRIEDQAELEQVKLENAKLLLTMKEAAGVARMPPDISEGSELEGEDDSILNEFPPLDEDDWNKKCHQEKAQEMIHKNSNIKWWIDARQRKLKQYQKIEVRNREQMDLH
jgi:hypothetical protein